MNMLASKRTTEVRAGRAAGFTLLEMMIALAVTTVVTGLAVTLLAASLNLRVREDRRSEAIADVRRALNTMTGEIANAGYELPPGAPQNGIVAADSDNTAIRILTNSDRFNGGATPESPGSQDEDVLFSFVNDAANGRRYIARYDVNSATTTVLANPIDSFTLRYFAEKVVYTPTVTYAGGVPVCDIADVRDKPGGVAIGEVPPAQARYIVVSVCVDLPAVGVPGSNSYQAPAVQQLTSDVQLRNATAVTF
ncbi:MAG TPA: prepilin-type N-terminal cleavage/methylation domain-containing protein [Pyrinomonadaceae bacterium]|jgi:prepilin-type N-terminal cleavage/methylation domain-containing protein